MLYILFSIKVLLNYLFCYSNKWVFLLMPKVCTEKSTVYILLLFIIIILKITTFILHIYSIYNEINIYFQLIKLMEDGIFASLRKKNISLSDDVFVNISTSHEKYWASETGYICSIKPVIGGPVEVVVDGSPNTAYCSLDKATPGDRYILFDFKANKVYVESFAIETICCPPNQMVVEGSNTGKNDWSVLKDVTSPLKEKNVHKFDCSYSKAFSKIRFKQIGGVSCEEVTNLRFHVRNIELYGHLLFYKPQITCHEPIKLTISIFLFIVIFKK